MSSYIELFDALERIFSHRELLAHASRFIYDGEKQEMQRLTMRNLSAN